MKNRVRKMMLVGIIMMILLGGCSSLSSIRKGWVCVNPENGFDCSYSLFTGQEIKTINLVAGDSINLSYDVVVISGELQIKFLDSSDSILWQFESLDSASDMVEVKIPKSGLYTIAVVGEKSEGSFNILWNVLN